MLAIWKKFLTRSNYDKYRSEIEKAIESMSDEEFSELLYMADDVMCMIERRVKVNDHEQVSR